MKVTNRHLAYHPPWWLRHGHASTVVAGLFRQALSVPSLQRRKYITSDGDFLDLDLALKDGKKLVVLLHGLEGNSRRPYMAGMQRIFHDRGWDTLAMNFRGCSGAPNDRLRSYHSGETEDLREVIRWTMQLSEYKELAIVGFSLGGNVVLKYLAEESSAVDPRLSSAVVFSVPCDLEASSLRLEKGWSRQYAKRFLRTLVPKALEKASRFPECLDAQKFRQVDSLRAFDDLFTAPVHGFRDARDYWRQSSSLPLLYDIRVPTMMVQAWDDPFLGRSCFPQSEQYLRVETTRYGGHVGFPGADANGFYWSEHRALRFCEGRG